MRYLVTGAAGFIGSHFCERVLAEGHEVVALDNFDDFYRAEIKRRNMVGFANRAQVFEGDVRDEAFVRRVFAEGRPDAVVHIAAKAGVRPSIDNPRLYIEVNVLGTLNLLEACRQHGVKNFTLASTSSIYGVNSKVPFSEDDPVHATLSPYAASKLCAEQLGSNYARLHGMRVVALRYFTVYGPRQRPDLAIHKFARNILEGRPITKYGSGETRRDYTYVDDIVDGTWRGAQYVGSEFEIFNLGNHETTSLNELIAALEEVCGRRAVIEQLPEQPGDVPQTYADISKAQRLLGYQPTTSVREGLGKFVAWLRQEIAAGR
jgi:UDP-glucuronate 4-epimerase